MRLPGLFPALFLASSLALSAQTDNQTSSTQLLNQGQRAYLAGDVDAAKAKFQAVLIGDPDNLTAKSYLKMIASMDQGTRKTDLAKGLSTLVLEKVTFKDASLDSVLAYLKDQAAKASGGKLTPSFVLQLPPDFAMQNTVTLDLAKVPFTEVLRYIGDLTATKFSIEQYAIVVKKA